MLTVVLSATSVRAQELPRFVEIAEEAGIDFVHNTGAFGNKYLPETMGSGCAFIDYNNDGWQDIILVNGMDWVGHATGKRQTCALYRNQGDGTFVDVSAAAGFNVKIYGMGAVVADYDNDGYDDVYLSAYRDGRLLRNRGNGTFSDVTQSAGIINPAFATSAAWLDYDKDGNLDLFIANYVQWTIDTDLFCTLDGTNKSYCTPESYDGQTSRLFRNRGDGTFVDVTRSARIENKSGKALGVCVFDYNEDGWPDIFQADDTQPNKLYHNNGDGTFIERGLVSGFAYNESGVATGAMGIDAGDYDGSGRESIIIGNFSNEMMNLYHNENEFFIDDAPVAKIGRPSLMTLTFACFFFDFDLDGRLDIFAANGHVDPDINAVQSGVTYAQPPHLFRNVDKRRFEDVAAGVGPDLARPIVGRGAAYGDIDNDGDWDLLVSTSGERAYLWRNDGASNNNWIKLKLQGTKSNRNGIGAKVTVVSASGTQTRTLKSGGSYVSQSELALIFGLGGDATAESITVEWLSGTADRLTNVESGQVLVVEEGQSAGR